MNKIADNLEVIGASIVALGAVFMVVAGLLSMIYGDTGPGLVYVVAAVISASASGRILNARTKRQEDDDE